MREAKFTNGPWESDEVSDDGAILALGGVNIAMVSSPDDFPCLDLDGLTQDGLKALWDEHRANRHLIAAAPELFEVLTEMVSFWLHAIEQPDGAIPSEEEEKQVEALAGRASAALAKARGEA